MAGSAERASVSDLRRPLTLLRSPDPVGRAAALLLILAAVALVYRLAFAGYSPTVEAPDYVTENSSAIVLGGTYHQCSPPVFHLRDVAAGPVFVGMRLSDDESNRLDDITCGATLGAVGFWTSALRFPVLLVAGAAALLYLARGTHGRPSQNGQKPTPRSG